MKTALGILVGIIFPVIAFSADIIREYDIETAMTEYRASKYYDSGIQHFFSDQLHPEPQQSFSEKSMTLRTSKAGKRLTKQPDYIPTEEEINAVYKKGCNNLFVLLLNKMNIAAKELGANGIVNIVSNFKDVEFSSAQVYRCHQGSFLTGIALEGEYVKF